MRFAQLRTVSDEPKVIGRAAGEMLEGARAKLLGEMVGVEVGRARGTFARGEAREALGTSVGSGEDGGAGGDALADERASSNDAFDGFSQGGTSAGVTDEVVELGEKGSQGIIPRSEPVH
jgi:hypothetical protein